MREVSEAGLEGRFGFEDEGLVLVALEVDNCWFGFGGKLGGDGEERGNRGSGHCCGWLRRMLSGGWFGWEPVASRGVANVLVEEEYFGANLARLTLLG